MPGHRAELVVTQEVGAPAETVWNALVAWDRQGEWMLGTRVRGTVQDGRGVGGGIEGWTGVGRIGFLDTMVITTWDPPRKCLVDHTGRLVRGTGAFEVRPLAERGCRIVWAEYLDLPWGPVGRIGWTALKPAARWGVVRSLRRLARLLEAEQGLLEAEQPSGSGR